MSKSFLNPGKFPICLTWFGFAHSLKVQPRANNSILWPVCVIYFLCDTGALKHLYHHFYHLQFCCFQIIYCHCSMVMQKSLQVLWKRLMNFLSLEIKLLTSPWHPADLSLHTKLYFVHKLPEGLLLRRTFYTLHTSIADISDSNLEAFWYHISVLINKVI